MHVHAYAGISPACRSALPLACACTRAQGRGLSPACLSQKFPTARGRRPSLSLRSGLSPARAASHWLSLASRASAPACKKRAAVRRRVHSCTCDATRRPARGVGGEVLGTAGFAQSGHHPVAAPAQPAVPSPRHGAVPPHDTGGARGAGARVGRVRVPQESTSRKGHSGLSGVPRGSRRRIYPFREPGQDPSAVRARARERISKPTTPPPLCVALPLASSLETFRASQRSP